VRVTSFNSNPRLHPSLAPLIRIAQSHGGVLSSTEARELGNSSRRLDTLARRGAITKFLGQWIVHSLVEHHHLAVAHALMFRIGPQTVVSGAAAAQCLGAIGEWPVRFGVDIPTAYPPSRSHMRIEGVRIVRRAMDGVVVPRGQLRLADRTTALLDCVDSVQSDMREGLLDFLLQQRWLKRELVETRIAARRSGQTGRRVTSAQLAAQRHALEGTESAGKPTGQARVSDPAASSQRAFAETPLPTARCIHNSGVKRPMEVMRRVSVAISLVRMNDRIW